MQAIYFIFAQSKSQGILASCFQSFKVDNTDDCGLIFKLFLSN